MRRAIRLRALAVAALLMVAALVVSSAHAAARTWTGAVSTEWNTAGNWSGSAIPGSGDDVTIPANVASGRYPVVSTAAANAKSVTLATGAGTQPALTVSANTLTVAGNFTVNAGTVTHSGGTIAVTAGAATITGTLNVSAGTFLSSVTLTVNNGGNVNVSGSGNLHLANATGTTPTDNLTIAAGGTVTQSGGTVSVRDFTSNAGSPDGTYNQSAGTFKIYHDYKNGGTFDSTGGTFRISGSGGGQAFNSPGTNQFFDLLVDPGVSADFDSSVAVQIFVRGDWTMNGTAAKLTGKPTTVTFNGSGTQTIGGTLSTTFRNLVVNKTSGTVTLSGNQAVNNGDLTITAGTLDLGANTLNRASSGGTLTVANGAALVVGGTNSFPTNYATHALGATSTVEYDGTNQSVSLESYGHLTLSGSGTKTMPGSAMTIAGNLTMRGTASATAAQALTVNGNFDLGSGTTFSASTYSHGVKGNFTNSGTFNPNTSTITLNGTSAQTIGGSSATTFNGLIINNASGISMSGVDATVNGTLSLTSGTVTTGANVLTVSSTGSVSRTSGHVVGNLRKHVATGATSRTFEIGDATSYTPVTVSFGSVTSAGNLTVSTTSGDHPNIGTAAINAAKSVNRYWSLTNSGITFNNYSAVLSFVAGDIDSGASTNSFVAGRYAAGSWSYPVVGARTATTTQITGLTAFGDLQIGESLTLLGNGTDPANSSLAPGGAATMADSFTFVTADVADSITAITVTLSSGSATGLSLVEITNDAGSTVYGSVANPGSDTPAITLTTAIPVSSSQGQYRIRVTPKSHAAMPAPAGSTYAVTAYVSNWTGSNGHGGSDSGGTTVTIDNLSPANATSASVSAGTSQTSLSWTNPGDSDLAAVIVLRRASAAVANVPAEGTTYVVGNTIGSSTVACVITPPGASCTDSGLINDTAYHYAIFARDTNGNYATGVVPSGSPATPRGTPVITVSKLSTVLNDPINGATMPLRIPGAIIEYSVSPSNGGNGGPDSGTVAVIDPIDAAKLAVNVTLGVTFTDGTTGSGLSLATVSYSSTPAPGPYVFSYTPVPGPGGFDGNVTAIKVTTTGTFAYGGSPNPSFTVKYQVKVK